MPDPAREIRAQEADRWSREGFLAAEAVTGESDYDRGRRDAYRDTAQAQERHAGRLRGGQ